MSTYEIGSIVFDKWKICRELGQGSYGTVYEIQREDFGGVYKAALKVITVPQSRTELQSVLAEGMTPPQAKQYFYSVVEDIGRECAIMSRLKGTGNIVSYEDHAVLRHPDGIGWDILIRMELLHPLLPYVYQHPMARRDIIKLGIDICKALELCQRYNIIHRDIKPENIFISDNGDYKLGDFGIARTIERTTSGLSKKGTYSYMAPEVYIGKKYGFSVDTYSLGLVLYRMLNKNRGPFLPQPPEAITFSSREQALGRRISGEALPRPFYGEGRLGEIVLKACAFDPKDRYSSPQQLRQELEAISYEAQDAALIYPNGDELQIDPSRYASGKSSGAAGTAGKTNAVFSDRPQRTSGTNRTQGVFDASGGGSPAPVRKEKKKAHRGLVWVLVLVAGAAIAAGSLLLLHTRQEKQAQLAAAQQVLSAAPEDYDARIKAIEDEITEKKIIMKDVILYMSKRAEMTFSKLALNRVKISLYDVVKTTGELKDVFRFTYNGHRYDRLSLSEKIRAGAEVSELVKRLTGRNYPVFFDNMESVDDLSNIRPTSQMILAKCVRNAELSVRAGGQTMPKAA